MIKVVAALTEDVHQGWVWLQDASLPARSVDKITNQESGDSVYCEALQIDKNFLAQYNKSARFTITDPASTLVIGEWFRACLGGLATQSEVDLRTRAANVWWGRFMACTGHPQIVVRLAAWLGGIGLVLGIMGLVLGVASFWPTPNRVGISG